MPAAVLEAPSRAEEFAALPEEERAERLSALTVEEQTALLRSWRFWARPSQMEPEGLWRWWVMSAGRGYGKNRSGSEWVCDRSEQFAARHSHHLIGLANSTYTDVRAVQVGGDSGLRRVCERRGHRLEIGKTSLEGRIRVWDEGWRDSLIEVHTADKPDNARGRNFATVWGDELSKWVQKIDAEGGTMFSNIDFSLRALCPKGLRPRGMITMTPKAIAIVRDLVGGKYGDTAVTLGSMMANRRNLAPSFIESVIRRYGGTRLGAQEIDGVLLDTVEGALWNGSLIEKYRHQGAPPDDLVRIVVGVDPPGGLRTECGIIVAGWKRVDGLPHLYVLADFSIAGAPEVWAPKVIAAARAWKADAVIAETNYGGLMVRDVMTVREPTLNVEVVTASRGKEVRAEPIAALWPDPEVMPGVIGRGHLCGYFGDLEGELTTWVPGDALSPNRLDALVWAGYGLLGPELVPPEAKVHQPENLSTPVFSGAPGRIGSPGLAQRVR